jgi:hypothetical protein
LLVAMWGGQSCAAVSEPSPGARTVHAGRPAACNSERSSVVALIRSPCTSHTVTHCTPAAVHHLIKVANLRMSIGRSAPPSTTPMCPGMRAGRQRTGRRESHLIVLTTAVMLTNSACVHRRATEAKTLPRTRSSIPKSYSPMLLRHSSVRRPRESHRRKGHSFHSWLCERTHLSLSALPADDACNGARTGAADQCVSWGVGGSAPCLLESTL